MAQADAEYRFLAAQVANRLDPVADHCGISGDVGEEDAVRTMGEYLLGGRRSRDHRDATAYLYQAAEDVPFHAEIDRHDMVPCRPRGQELRRELTRATLVPGE